MYAMLMLCWPMLAPAHAGGEVPSTPLVLVQHQPAPPPPARVVPSPTPEAAAWLEKARLRHKTARTGGTLVGVGLPVAAVGVGLVGLGTVGSLIGGSGDDSAVLGYLVVGSTFVVGGGIAAIVGIGTYTIASVSASRALTLAGHPTSGAAGIAGIVCFGLSFIPTPFAGLTGVAAIVLGAVQTTINGSQLRAVAWSMAPAMLGARTPGLAFSARF